MKVRLSKLHPIFLLLQILLVSPTFAASSPTTHPNELRSSVVVEKGESVMEKAGLSEYQPKKIILISGDPNLGDSLIFEYARIGYLHERYPNAKILVVGPQSGILKESPWLRTLPLPYVDALKESDVEKIAHGEWSLGGLIKPILDQEIEPETLIMSEGGGFGKPTMDALKTYLNAHHTTQAELSPEVANRLRRAFAHSAIWDAAKEKNARAVEFNYVFWPGKAKVILPGYQEPLPIEVGRKAEDNGIINAYERSAFYASKHFGKDAYVSWDPALFFDPTTSSSRRGEYLKKTFKNPEQPYVVIELNTKGQWKVEKLHHDYEHRLNEIITRVSSEHPSVNLLVAPPIEVFGEDVSNKVKSVVAKAQARGVPVAFLPDKDFSIRLPVFEGASAIAAMDSGGYHLASIFNPHVMIMSRGLDPLRGGDTVTASSKWHRPGNPWMDFESGHEPLYQWLNQVLPKESASRCKAGVAELVRKNLLEL